MVSHRPDLHGNAPDHSPVALVLIDVINDLAFPGSDDLLSNARAMAKNLSALKQQCTELGISCIYVNDNFGRWRSDLHAQVDHCLEPDVKGREIVMQLLPQPNDYFVLKPKNSAFFSTSFEILLQYLQTRTLILTGLTGHNCVLFTAHDAYLRDYSLIIPSDCVASPSTAENEFALRQMQSLLKAKVLPSSEINLSTIIADAEHAVTGHRMLVWDS